MKAAKRMSEVNIKPERYLDLERNKIINRCETDLERIITGHDPEVHNLHIRVWDRLDLMATEIELHTKAASLQDESGHDPIRS